MTLQNRNLTIAVSLSLLLHAAVMSFFSLRPVAIQEIPQRQMTEMKVVFTELIQQNEGSESEAPLRETEAEPPVERADISPTAVPLQAETEALVEQRVETPPPLEQTLPMVPVPGKSDLLDSAAVVDTSPQEQTPPVLSSAPTPEFSPGNPGGTDYPGTELETFSFTGARMPIPPYPRRARDLGWEGEVVISFIINEKGKVKSLEILEGSGYSLLDQSVAETVKKGWRFPGREAPLRVWKRFSFRLI